MRAGEFGATEPRVGRIMFGSISSTIADPFASQSWRT